jgi:hypothetical protein
MSLRTQLLPESFCLLQFVSPVPFWNTPEGTLDWLRHFRRLMEPVSFTLAYAVLPQETQVFIHLRDEHTLFDFFRKEGRFPDENETVQSIQKLNESLAAQQFNVYDKQLGKWLTALLPEAPKKIQVQKESVKEKEEILSHITRLHLLPVTRGLCSDASEWKFSSFQAILSEAPTAISREQVLDLFGGREAFVRAHEAEPYKRLSV